MEICDSRSDARSSHKPASYGTKEQTGGWPSVAKLTWDQRGGAGD